MLAVWRTKADGRACATSLRLQLLMRERRFPMVDDSMDCGRVCKSRVRRGVGPSCGSKSDNTSEMRFITVEIGL